MIDPEIRLRRLVASAEGELRGRFLAALQVLREQGSLDELAELLAQGRQIEAVQLVEEAADLMAAATSGVMLGTGAASAEFLSSALGLIIAFDQSNPRAVRIMRGNRLRLAAELALDQREAITAVIADGIARGINPRQQAVELRENLGLTRNQVRAVQNYRRALETGSRVALQRELRDRRFDRTVEAAIEGRRQLTPQQIDRMVQRYRERFLRFRAENIARTEALRSVHEGADEMYRQLYDAGVLNPEEVESTWNVRLDGKQRESHATMSGQVRIGMEPFTSGNGNSLRHPGDPDAPASETIRCRCAVSRRIVTP